MDYVWRELAKAQRAAKQATSFLSLNSGSKPLEKDPL